MARINATVDLAEIAGELAEPEVLNELLGLIADRYGQLLDRWADDIAEDGTIASERVIDALAKAVERANAEEVEF